MPDPGGSGTLHAMLGTLQNIIDRFDRSGRSPAPPERRAPVPVVTALDDPGLVDEVGLVIAVTGREHLTWDPDRDLPGEVTGVILVTGTDAGPDAGEAAVADLVARGVAVRTVTVTADAGCTAPPPLFLLPGQAADLAAHLGASDLPDCTVYGAVGGAGTSTFATALAGALADPALGGDGQSLLVDASGHGDLEHLLGLEDTPGRRLRDLAGTVTLSAAGLRDLPWTGDVAVLTGAGAPPAVLDVCCPVVRDGGRWAAGTGAGGGPGTATGTGTVPGTGSGTVLVVPATVPGTLVGRAVLDRVPGASVVLREIPRAELEWNDALTLLGRAPDVDWRDDPFVTGETDRGGFVPDIQATGTAGTAAARLARGLW